MKKVLFILLMDVCVLFHYQCNAQHKVFSYYGSVEPCQMTFDSSIHPELFQQFLSLFEIHTKLGKSNFEATAYDGWHKEEIDMKYWIYTCKAPGFKVFPCFRLDCKDGYLVGIYSIFDSHRACIGNLDVISYDKSGRILGKTSFPNLQFGFFRTQDSCRIAYQSCGGLLYVEKRFVRFEYSSSRHCTPEVAKGVAYSHDPKEVRKEKRQYIYKIEDNACLTLISVSDIEEE